MKTKVLKYALEERTLYVVLYWVGSPNHPNSSLRSTGAYSRRFGEVRNDVGKLVVPSRLDVLQDDLSASGYQTAVVESRTALGILSQYAPTPRREYKLPKVRQEKKKRKSTKPLVGSRETFSKYQYQGVEA